MQIKIIIFVTPILADERKFIPGILQREMAEKTGLFFN